MKASLAHIIGIGYGRHLFDVENQERMRLGLCAKECAGLHMVVFSLRSHGLAQQEDATGLRLYPTNSRWRMMMIFDAIRIGRRIARTHKHVLCTTQDPFETAVVGWVLKKLCDIPLIVQEHADVFSSAHWARESMGNRLRLLLGARLLRRADVVRVVSERIERTLRMRGLAHTITRLPVAIDVRPFTTLSPERVERSFPRDTFQFISVARFVPQKNLQLMLEAFAEVYRQLPHVRLVLVGTGPLEAELHRRVEQLFPSVSPDSIPVRFLPWSDNVPGLLKGSDAYVLTSNYEGWARVLIEALCSNLPIITTDVGCVGEVVLDGVHGRVAPVDDKSKLIECCTSMVRDGNRYAVYKRNLALVDRERLPGARIEQYGRDWLQTTALDCF